MSKDKVTGFFVEDADFCKAFDRELKKHPVESNKPGIDPGETSRSISWFPFPAPASSLKNLLSIAGLKTTGTGYVLLLKRYSR